MNATTTAPTPTKITSKDIKSGKTFYNPEDTAKLVPLRIVHMISSHVMYRLGSDTQRTITTDAFLSLADYMGFKNIPENATN